ncbi:MAG: S8 family serine peptidase [Mucilaginibacter sp.]|uniref:S8 family serine peptidase n=1 Tax=Mucilaginibacter sp. TaxID=1882438 RepID=UPI0032653E4C
MSQNVLTNAVQIKQLGNLSTSLTAVSTANRKKAYDLAAKKGWMTFKVTNNGAIISLAGVDERGAPVYLMEFNNVIAAGTTRTNTVQGGGTLGLNLSGSSTQMAGKLGIWDGGRILTTHQEFAGKTITAGDGSSTVSDHSTHVAGTMVAKGVYAPAKGMSYGATTLLSYDFNNDAGEMATAAPNLLVSNHSYGYVVGWNYNDAQARWEWLGLAGDTEDYRFGFYDSNAQAFDQIAFNAPKYLIVVAAGNNRGSIGPPVGVTYFGYNTRTDFTIVNKGPRPATISSNNSYDVLALTANAKNILTVGAVNPLPNGPVNVSDVQVASFSSWGPTDDGRVKPDICGDGVNVLSTGPASNDNYIVESGTSMATPNVSGSLFLLQEYYSQKNSGNFMLSATLKGLACHTAFDAGNPGPDYIYGWGLLDMQKAAQAITDNGTKSIVSEKTLTQGQTQTITVVASGNGPLKATIVWTDPAGTPTASGTINSRTPKLVNDLDIRVSDASITYTPWVLNPANPSANATTSDNSVDNVEQVYLANAVPGVSYTIKVSHKGTLSGGAQNYSLIVTGVGGSAYCASAPGSSADSRINNVTLGGINNTQTTGCTTYSNYTNLIATLEQGKTYPISLTLGTCGASFNKIAKVYIDWNGNDSFTDAGELVATTPVISTATGTYSTTISVPATVVPGNFSLMRVVLTETSDPTQVTPCGTYGKGETQDYKVAFVKASIDVGVTAINTPATNGTCPGSNSTVSVHLKNFGTVSQTAIPVTVTLTSGTGVITTLNDTYTGTLAPLAETDFTLASTFTAVAGSSYTVLATTNLASDFITTNNQASSTAVVNNSPVITSSNATYCNYAETYTLTATGAGSVFWYKSLTDANVVAVGPSATTIEKPVTDTFYAGINDFSGDVGPANKGVFSAGGYNQFTGAVYVTTAVPLVIKSARLYIGNSGKITFNVATEGGAVVSSTTIDAVATKSNPAPGATLDDATDQGAIYNLNLVLPVAGNYILSIAYPDNATIYRSNGGVTGYPFSIGNIFSITKNNATSGTTPVDPNFYKSFYYYFYNMHVQAFGCQSVARVAVPLSKPIVTLNGVNLVSNISQGNQWFLNGNSIAGATNATYTPASSGIYRIDVTGSTGCISRSDDFSFVLPAKDNNDGSEIALAVFPVPSNGRVNLAFNATKSESLSVSVVNSAGQSVYKTSNTIATGPYNDILNLTNLPSGIYFMQLTIGDKTYLRRLSIAK